MYSRAIADRRCLGNRVYASVAVVSFILMLAPGRASAQATKFSEEALTGHLGTFAAQAQPLLQKYCYACHAAERVEAEINLADFKTANDVRQQPRVWQMVGEMLESQQMPPPDSRQPTDAERAMLRNWVDRYLQFVAAKSAGDPGRVVLRRLNNAEYTYTLRDLTGVPTLSPAREFPVDGAAGEGFTNTGAALAMSPAFVTKYLDAAKEVAQHAVLLPSGIRFSSQRTRSDWTNEKLDEIRSFYRQFTNAGGGDKVNLQGIVFDTNQGGRLPLERYLLATIEQREALRAGSMTVAEVARKYNISPKYLTTLWNVLNAQSAPGDTTGSNQAAAIQAALLLEPLRIRWREAKPADAGPITVEVARWQQALWRFTSVGHIGKVNGPKAWMEPVSPLTERQEFKVKLTPPADGSDLVLYLVTGDAGDGREGDIAVWERPRLVAPGRPDVLLRDVRSVTQELTARREQMFASAAACLQAAATIHARAMAGENSDVAVMAAQFQVAPEMLTAWLDYLGIGVGGPAKIGKLITTKTSNVSNYQFVTGWAAENALSVLANSSDQAVRVPGDMKPRSIAVHPSPSQSIAIGWRAPQAGRMKIAGTIQHVHAVCGNGTSWVIELRRGATRQRLAAGNTNGANVIPFGPFENLAMQVDDLIAVVVSPRDNHHACDLTAVDLTITSGERTWDLAKEVSPNILAANPHADSHGNNDVWHFFWEPATGAAGPTIPAGSILAKWQVADGAEAKQQLATQLQSLLQGGADRLPKDSPDLTLYRELTSLGGPLLASALRKVSGKPADQSPSSRAPSAPTAPNAAPADRAYGLDPALFGKDPRGGAALDPASLAIAAPAVVEVRLPSNLVAGAELVASGYLAPENTASGSVQLQVLTTKPTSTTGLQPSKVEQTNANGPWTSNNRGIAYGAPIIVAKGSRVRQPLEAAFSEFRQLFPPALCYTKIVPVDEVVTLTLFYREDDHLQRLMLNDEQIAHLNRLWDELHFISHDALTLVDAFAQLMEYATQDADPKVFEPLRKPINDRAAAFRQQLIDAEPRQLDAVLEFARQAIRRPMTEAEVNQLRNLYAGLRQQEIPHEDAIRLTIARVLVSPAFLYRAETPVEGNKPGPVGAWELANRLSYFLWSSQPDAELRRLAASGELLQPKVLQAQTRRMLRDPKARRLAIEFACQWLHIHDFAQFDEKSEQVFPTFADLRSSMYEESIRFFTDLFQQDGRVLDIVTADHTFLNEKLAKHYGIPWRASNDAVVAEDAASATEASGPWQRVSGVAQHGRGGILTQAATLSKQAGASRTSPILRGNWLSEVVLGEKLPRPPKGVPPLAETTPTGLTERQLIEQHSADAACAKCHARIDPFGFALENYDAIGRLRQKDAAGLAIDSRTKLLDGTKLEGLSGIRDYVATTRREAFVKQFNKKLLGYSLGRSVQLSDMPLLGELNSQALSPEGQVGTVIERIVLSPQFREIRGRENADEE